MFQNVQEALYKCISHIEKVFVAKIHEKAKWIRGISLNKYGKDALSPRADSWNFFPCWKMSGGYFNSKFNLRSGLSSND